MCYLSYSGKPIKAARLFSGKEHEQALLSLNKHFNTPLDYYTSVKYNSNIKIDETVQFYNAINEFEASHFIDFETAYHYLIANLVQKQVISTNLMIANSNVKRIFVDGGFSNNEIFMNLLAKGYNQYEVFAAAIPQASAIGAALAVHEKWNSKSIPNNLISLQYYSTKN